MSTTIATSSDRYAVLRLPEVRYLLVARLCGALGGMGFATVISYQLYQLTKDPLSLGLLGLIEAIPALSLALIGGYIADRTDRKRLLIVADCANILCYTMLAMIAFNPARFGLWSIYAVVFVLGLASGFYRPTASAFEQQVIPLHFATSGASWMSTIGQTGAIVGAPIAGLMIDQLGIAMTYVFIAILMSIALILILPIARRPVPTPEEGETIWQSLRQGVRFVFRSQPLVGSMALDLFAVLFGGAMALLPVFAEEILHVGAFELGIMRTAPALGALLIFALAIRHPPTHNAGRNLLLCVAGFGVSMIVFGISRNFYLSLVGLFFSGVFDGVSMIIRDVIVRVLSPDAMRGRINSVSWIFIGASNEIGAFESGIAAKLLGTAPSVYLGGCVTLLVVAAVAATMPKLRALKL